jgi:hypothetical protein
MGFVNARSDVRTQQVMSKMETTSSGVSIQGALDATAIGNNLIDIVYPIGFIITTFTNTNPSTQLANTTWVRFGEGKCVVGVDDTDADFATGATGGEKTNTLAIQNIPSHTHTYSDYIRDATYGAQQTGASNYAVGGVQLFQTTNTGSAGGDGNGDTTPINNLQPYISCYMWRRTA